MEQLWCIRFSGTEGTGVGPKALSPRMAGAQQPTVSHTQSVKRGRNEEKECICQRSTKRDGRETMPRAPDGPSFQERKRGLGSVAVPSARDIPQSFPGAFLFKLRQKSVSTLDELGELSLTHSHMFQDSTPSPQRHREGTATLILHQLPGSGRISRHFR